MTSKLPAAPIRRAALLAVVGTTLSLHGLAAAQECGSGWLEIVPERGTYEGNQGGILAATTWDPDGAEGPQEPVLVVGGIFTRAGGRPASNVATWDGERWAPLGAELTRTVTSLAVQADGTLIASTHASASGNLIWKWDGNVWQPLLPLPSGVTGTVLGVSLCPLPDGNLVFGGSFQFLNTAPPTFNIGLFDDISINSMGGFSAQPTLSVKRLSNGDIVSGPTSSGSRLNRWNGTTWDAFGIFGCAPFFVESANGDIITASLSPSLVHRMNAAASQPIGGQFSRPILAVGTLPDDTVIAAHGTYSASRNGGLYSRVSRWDGATWVQIGEPTLNAINLFARDPNGHLFLGTRDSSATAAQLWTGSRWIYPAENLNGPVSDIAMTPNGEVLLAGAFDSVGMTQLRGLARRDASSPGRYAEIEGPWKSVSRIAVSPSGTIFVSAMMRLENTEDLATFPMLARVGTQTVDQLGPAETFGGIQRIEALSDNELIAVGSFITLAGVPASRAAIWNGTTWAELQGGLNGTGQTVTRLPTGGVVIGGSFTTAGAVSASNIAIWQNAAWSPLAGGVNGTVNWVRILQDGSIAAAGAFTAVDGSPASGFATWNGTAWTGVVASLDGLTPISISEFTELPSGDIVARGTFRNGQGPSQSTLTRLHNGVWSYFTGAQVSGALSLDVDTHGELLVGGNFGYIDNTWSYFARYADAGSLWLALQPTDTTATWGSESSLTVQAASGYDRFGTLTYTWTHNEQPVIDDGRISGASTATLNFAFVRANDAGAYVCTVSNGCGTAISETANLEVVGCAGDFDADGDFDSDDIIGFFQAWDEGNDNADADNDGDTDSDDLIEFFTKWDQGSCD